MECQVIIGDIQKTSSLVPAVSAEKSNTRILTETEKRVRTMKDPCGDGFELNLEYPKLTGTYCKCGEAELQICLPDGGTILCPVCDRDLWESWARSHGKSR